MVLSVSLLVLCFLPLVSSVSPLMTCFLVYWKIGWLSITFRTCSRLSLPVACLIISVRWVSCLMGFVIFWVNLRITPHMIRKRTTLVENTIKVKDRRFTDPDHGVLLMFKLVCELSGRCLEDLKHKETELSPLSIRARLGHTCHPVRFTTPVLSTLSLPLRSYNW